MKKIVISGYFGFYNTGDEAILSAILIALKNTIPNSEFTILSGNPNKTVEQHKVKAVSINFLRLLHELYHADILISGGGGLLFDWYDKRIPWNIIWWLKPIILAKLMNKKVMIYAQGVGPIDSIIGKILIRIIVNKCDVISVRDIESKKLLKKIGISKPIYLTADPAITLSPAKPDRINEILSQEGVAKEHKYLVGISVRHWFNSTKYKRVLAQIANDIISEFNANIVFIPMHISSNIDDREIAFEIVREMHRIDKDKVHIITGKYAPQEIMGIIGQMDMIIGMRLHSLIFAAATNVPTVGLVYDPKVKGFLEMIDQEGYAIDIKDLNYDTVISKIDDVWRNKEKIKSDLESKMDDIKERALLNAKLVRDLVLEGER